MPVFVVEHNGKKKRWDSRVEDLLDLTSVKNALKTVLQIQDLETTQFEYYDPELEEFVELDDVTHLPKEKGKLKVTSTEVATPRTTNNNNNISNNNNPTQDEEPELPDDPNDPKYDAFLSHRQKTGADLAQSLKLQLEHINSGIKIFLDVDDLHNIQSLRKNIKNSANIILLITEGVLERPFVQLEIRTALKYKKNIILVHDEKSCPFPTDEGLPDDVKSVLAIKAIPYYREKQFRDVTIRSVYQKLVFDRKNTVKAKLSHDLISVWTDRGSGAPTDCSLWKHKHPSPGWFLVGDVATDSYSMPSGGCLIVAEEELKSASDPNLLAPPSNCELVWQDRGSGAQQDCSIWKLIPPSGYVSLGLVTHGGYSKPDLEYYRCVREDYVVEGMGSSRAIWKYQKTGPFALWSITPKENNEGVANSGLFVATSSHDRPTTGICTLKKSCLI